MDKPGKKMSKWVIVVVVIVLIVAFNKVKSYADKRRQDDMIKKSIEEDMNKDLNWPNTPMAALLPKMENKKGKVALDSADELSIEVYKVTKEEYDKYVEMCKELGFIVDYKSHEGYYEGLNTSGYKLSIWKYDTKPKEGMSISLSKMKEEDQVKKQEKVQEKSEEKEEKQKEKQVVQTKPDEDKEEVKKTDLPAVEVEEKGDKRDEWEISSDVKDALDAYEEVMMKYCDFMEKYNEDKSDLSLITDYTDMVQKQLDATAKFDQIKTDTLTIAELSYYNEVNGRVLKRLSQIQQ